MNWNRSKQFLAIAASAALVLSGSFALATAPQASAAPRRLNWANEGSLVGTWRVQVQSYVCGTSTLIGPPFSSVLTFNDGGTFTGDTMNPSFAVGQRGVDQGVWAHKGDHTYSAKDVAFIYFTTPPNPPANPGFQTGTQILSQTIKLKDDLDEFTSEATTEFFDATGASYRQGCATAVAQRFK